MKLRSRTISAPPSASSAGDDDAGGSNGGGGGVERNVVEAEVRPPGGSKPNAVRATEPVEEVHLSEDPSPCDDIGNYVLDTASDDSGHTSDGDFEMPFNLNQVPESSCSDFDDDGGESSVRHSRKRKKATRTGTGDGNSNAPPLDEAEAVDNPDVLVDLEADLNLPPLDEAEDVHVLPDIEQILRQVRKKKKRKDKDKPVLLWEIWEAEDDKWIDRHIKEDANLDHMNHTLNETVDDPKDLILPLLRYQKEWLAWGLKQEESSTRGGILADEMGMGKTLQAISLVLAKREIRTAIGEANMSSSSPSSSTSLPEIQCTLVICPVVAVTQWVNEIDHFTRKGSCKVLVYHGANRGKTVQHLSGYDFVITTYSTVEADYRRNVMPPKKKCEWCGKSYHERQMATHLKYFCGPGAVRTEKQSKQDRKFKKPSMKSLKKSVKLADDNCKDREDAKQKQPQKKTGKKRKPSQKDQTDHTVDEPFDNDLNENKKNSILHSVKWERVVLDEAHYIKDKRSNTARAILALESSFKWALSGTPLQNRVGELYSLIRFLRIVPYSFYFCKDCDCRVLDHSPASECKHCPHNSVRHFCWWNRYVATPIQESGNSDRGRRAMIMLKHKILKSVLLRRTKKDRASDLALPPRIISLRRDTLDIKEEDYYTSLYNESQAQFNTYVQQGTVLNNYAHIFDLLTRLRQAVDHPYLVVYSNSNSANRGNTGHYDQNEPTCGICHETVEDPVVTSCAHPFCKACLIDYSSSLGEVSCPTCSKPLTVDFSSSSSNGDLKGVAAVKGFKRSSILNRINLDDFQTSTKIDALREEIRFMIERDGAAKGIVFSQFTSFLDLINYSLQKSGVKCVQLVGSMTMGARDAAIKKFNEDADCRIFLMSLKAGGVALNLTVASHVFLMDPWWNPAVERQAQDRIHRIGQYKPIRIVRFVIANTVEERILQLQEKKELVFEGTVGGSNDALGKLTEADLRFLFIT